MLNFIVTQDGEVMNLIEYGEQIAQMRGVHFSVYHDFQGMTSGKPDSADYLAPNTEFLKFNPSIRPGCSSMLHVSQFKIESVHAHFKREITELKNNFVLLPEDLKEVASVYPFDGVSEPVSILHDTGKYLASGKSLEDKHTLSQDVQLTALNPVRIVSLKAANE